MRLAWQMRHAFLSKKAGDFAASVGFRRLRGYISSAARRASASAANLPTLFESRGGNRNACRGRHRAWKPSAILFPDDCCPGLEYVKKMPLVLVLIQQIIEISPVFELWRSNQRFYLTPWEFHFAFLS